MAGTPTSQCSGAGCGAAQIGAGATGVSLFIEPAAGETPVLHAIERAQRSVWVEVYLLTDRNVINALDDAANRGVDVRVLLEMNPYGSGSTNPQVTLQELEAAGVKAKGSDPIYHYTHEKAIIVDGVTLEILRRILPSRAWRAVHTARIVSMALLTLTPLTFRRR